MVLAKKMTPQSMAAYYNSGGRIADIVQVTGKSYEEVQRSIRENGGKLVTGGHGRQAR